MTEEMNEYKKIIVIVAIFIAIGLFVAIFGILDFKTSDCKEANKHEDTYCVENCFYPSNLTGTRARCEWVIGNHTENEVKKLAQLDAEKERIDAEKERKACYEKGKNYNLSFDLIEDYGLSCEQINYYNDHLILGSQQKDGGSIEVKYNGFFSSRSTKVQLYDWINVEYLATGRLVKNTQYHEDCRGETLYWQFQTICNDGKVFPDEVSSCYGGYFGQKETKIINYYTESDFVFYYVNNCLEGSPKESKQ